MAPNATAAAPLAAPAPATRPLAQHPSVFQGDGEGMVDLLVDACVTAKEAQRQASLAAGGSPPRAGRDLVPYFNPGSTDWGLEDVNGNTADAADEDSSFDGGSSRGYDSSSSTGVRRRASAKEGKDKQPKASAAPAKSRKNSKRGKKAAPGGDKEAARASAAAALQLVAAAALPAAPLPPPPSEQLTKFAGTTFGLASPMPESLPMPTAALLTGSPRTPVPAPALHHEATNALRGLLQLEVAAATSLMATSRLPAAALCHTPATPVMV